MTEFELGLLIGTLIASWVLGPVAVIFILKHRKMITAIKSWQATLAKEFEIVVDPETTKALEQAKELLSRVNKDRSNSNRVRSSIQPTAEPSSLPRS